jgi:hypothetical protein
MAHPRGFPAAAPDLSTDWAPMPWSDEALCAQTDPDMWFAERVLDYVTTDGHKKAAAIAICQRCPVLEQCRAYAIADPHLEGIWGGTTERERIAIRAGRAL